VRRPARGHLPRQRDRPEPRGHARPGLQRQGVGLNGSEPAAATIGPIVRRRKKLVLAGAVVALLLVGGGAAAAYLIVTRPAADVHNGAQSPFTSTPEPTTSTPTRKTVKVDYGPPWPMYGRNPAHNRDASELTSIKPPYRVSWVRPGRGTLE